LTFSSDFNSSNTKANSKVQIFSPLSQESKTIEERRKNALFIEEEGRASKQQIEFNQQRRLI